MAPSLRGSCNKSLLQLRFGRQESSALNLDERFKRQLIHSDAGAAL